MAEITTESYRSIIECLMKENGIPPDSLMIVDDVEQWCVDQGIIKRSEYYPFRAAKCLYSKALDRFMILVSRCITDGMKASIKGCVFMKFGDQYRKVLDNDLKFLQHLVLHEIAHTKGLSEEECDRWAFDKLAET